MIPLHDDNPTEIRPYVTWALIAVCVLVFLWQQTPGNEPAVLSLGFIPAVLFGSAELAPELVMVPAALTPVTAMFLHGGWMHLIGNMLYLWIFGNNVEDAMGHGRFVAFYLVCGLAAAAAQAALDPASRIPMIGASGAIAGVLGAYALLYPRARVLVLVPIFVIFFTVRLPALWVLGGWFVLQGINAALADSSGGGVAWWAHIGGFVAGLALIWFFKRRSIKLLATPARSPSGLTVVRSRIRPSRPSQHVPTVSRRRRGPWGRP
ncbi:MAG: rhomboid family intramembrane serine protease [Alphaproteobacteria bacterium]|jgi:membrane associated rhomboid family serine protease|nr:rhomboid family intramembrane serine protease [Rhodospirillaceae bacterium]MDP6403871.1 rhomboid family intramembrane serine protease [Alphaproteobacteria bacterium]MDP6622279.1 rhomboid family intramembrane serine protease [Alphaproteobacteria bacterium]|tara:strand:+ start:813 stop:1604 length:792 start_codon:yes stop_codon:yes gene_type:complete